MPSCGSCSEKGTARRAARMLAGALLVLTISGCTVERFFVLNETNNYPTAKATPTNKIGPS